MLPNQLYLKRKQRRANQPNPRREYHQTLQAKSLLHKKLDIELPPHITSFTTESNLDFNPRLYVAAMSKSDFAIIFNRCAPDPTADTVTQRHNLQLLPKGLTVSPYYWCRGTFRWEGEKDGILVGMSMRQYEAWCRYISEDQDQKDEALLEIMKERKIQTIDEAVGGLKRDSQEMWDIEEEIERRKVEKGEKKRMEGK